jgi:hypothetical protein
VNEINGYVARVAQIKDINKISVGKSCGKTLNIGWRIILKWKLRYLENVLQQNESSEMRFLRSVVLDVRGKKKEEIRQ